MKKKSDADLGQLLEMISPWVLVGALVVACLLTGLSLAVFGLGRSKQPPQLESTAMINVIPAPTFTPGPAATAAETPGEGTSVPSGPIGKGSFVKVSGTAGNGLRLRDQPGLKGKVLLLGTEAEVLQSRRWTGGGGRLYLVVPGQPVRPGPQGLGGRGLFSGGGSSAIITSNRANYARLHRQRLQPGCSRPAWIGCC